MKPRITLLLRLTLFVSFFVLIPYALVNGTQTLTGCLTNAAEACACPVAGVSVDPMSRTIEPGESTTYQVTVSLYSSYHFKGLIVISLTDLPSGVSCPAIEISDSDGDLTAVGTLSVSSTCGLTPETYRPKLTVVARYPNPDSYDPYTGNPKNVTLTVTAPIPCFTVDAHEKKHVKAGEDTFFTTVVKWCGGYTGNVTLSVDKDGLPAGVTYDFDTNPVSPAGHACEGNAQTKLNIHTESYTPSGEYTLVVRGTSGDITDTDTVTLTVTEGGDFSLSADPTEQEIEPGDKADFKVIGTFSEGFEGEVELSAVGSPSGPPGSFSPKSISTKVRDSLLTVTTGSDTKPGTYEITITGTHATLGTRTTKVTLTVTGTSDFSLSADPTSQEIEPGDTATYTITVNKGGSFPPYPVEFPDPTDTGDMTATIEPSSLPEYSNTNSVTLTVETGPSVKEGTYTITVNAEGGGYTNDVTVTLVVKKPVEKFYLSAGPQTPSEIEPGETAEFKISAYNFLERVTFSISGALPDGVKEATFDPSQLPAYTDRNWVTLTVKTDSTITKGTYDIIVRGVCGDQSDGVVVTLTVGETPVPESAGLTVDKSVTPSSAKVGGILLYTIRITNTGRGTLTGILIRDNMPAGVGYVKGSAVIDGKSLPDPSGSTTLVWEIDDLKGGETTTLKYHGVVKPNISRGRSTNTVTITGTDPTGRTLVARDSADLGVSAEDLDRKGKIKGKVFIDENGNGLKNVDEEGIAGISVILESGERTSTDEEGMFQFDEVDSGEHLVGIDVRKLSKEYFVIGDSSKIVSLFSGGTGRTYFGLGRTGPTKEELEAIKKAEEEQLKKEEEARKEEEKKKKEEQEKKAPKGTLLGNVFVDANDNNIFNPGEKLLEKVTVLLDNEKRAITDRMGNYRFNTVKEGRHTLSIYEDKEFKKSYRPAKKEKITVNVKANTNNRKDIPALNKSKLKINIELTVR
ncbi:MAG: DUF11 domain-containing protein [Deltaproteobacteria bacterium]|nr:DUF11 domain-containing protein [Candidatus Zymogenaceae bacterium]